MTQNSVFQNNNLLGPNRLNRHNIDFLEFVRSRIHALSPRSVYFDPICDHGLDVSAYGYSPSFGNSLRIKTLSNEINYHIQNEIIKTEDIIENSSIDSEIFDDKYYFEQNEQFSRDVYTEDKLVILCSSIQRDYINWNYIDKLFFLDRQRLKFKIHPISKKEDVYKIKEKYSKENIIEPSVSINEIIKEFQVLLVPTSSEISILGLLFNKQVDNITHPNKYWMSNNTDLFELLKTSQNPQNIFNTIMKSERSGFIFESSNVDLSISKFFELSENIIQKKQIKIPYVREL